MRENISVRQWQALYRGGAFAGKDLDTQRAAGWWDWECHDTALAGRLKKIASVVMGIKEPLILDNYSVCFSNHRTDRELLYDNMQFEPLDKAEEIGFFMIFVGYPEEPYQFTLYTRRFGIHTAEFGCERACEMVQYISGVARESSQGIRPPFLDEKEAAVEYILFRGTVLPSRALRREGEHSYSFQDRDDGRRKIVHVSASLEDGPPGFRADGAVEVNGFYVFCPEDAEKAVNVREKRQKGTRKKREETER